MIITPANLNIFFTGLDTRFWTAYSNAPTWHATIATIYPATTETWLQGWISMLDKLRVWKGPRIVRTPAPQTYGVTMLPFELTEPIDQFKLEDDQHGIYGPLIAMMGENSAKWPDYTLRDLLEGLGDFASTGSQTGTDGVAHWSASHPVDPYDAGKGTYVNDYGASGTSIDGITVGGAFGTQSYATAWEDMAGRLNESGEAIGVNPDRVAVPTQLLFPARVVLQSMMFSPPVLGTMGTGATGTANAPFVGNMDNPLRGSADITATPDLNAHPTAWYLGDTSDVMKPLGWAVHTAPTYVVRNAPTDPSVFDQHRFLHGSWAYATPHWGFAWQLSRSGI